MSGSVSHLGDGDGGFFDIGVVSHTDNGYGGGLVSTCFILRTVGASFGLAPYADVEGRNRQAALIPSSRELRSDWGVVGGERSRLSTFNNVRGLL